MWVDDERGGPPIPITSANELHTPFAPVMLK